MTICRQKEYVEHTAARSFANDQQHPKNAGTGPWGVGLDMHRRLKPCTGIILTLGSTSKGALHRQPSRRNVETSQAAAQAEGQECNALPHLVAVVGGSRSRPHN